LDGFFFAIDFGRAIHSHKEILIMEQINTQEKTGTVKWFDARKGYGFIAQEDGKDVFVHANNMADPFATSLTDGDKVKFLIGQGPKGPTALEVRRIS
jgi:CspA family cold shock protein